MKLLVFDVWGDFAHFRKFYTTSSPLSFSFPPPPTIAGILGAMFGANKFENEYLTIFLAEDSYFSIQIIESVKKIRFGINLVETKGTNLRRPFSDKNLAPRTQIRTEFVRSPKYRIFFTHKSYDIYSRVLSFAKNHQTIFTLSLGLSQLLANFEFIGEFEYVTLSETNDEFVNIFSPILLENLISKDNSIIFEEGKKYFREKIPVKMNKERIVTAYADAIFEPNGFPIKAKVRKFQKLENGVNITFF